jgi:hypothetical protein
MLSFYTKQTTIIFLKKHDIAHHKHHKHQTWP